MTRLSGTLTNWLKVVDLPGSPDSLEGYLGLTIKSAEFSTFADGKMSLDLTFLEHDKKFGCNVTNRERLSTMAQDPEVVGDTVPGLIGWRVKIGKEWDRAMGGGQQICCRIQGAQSPSGAFANAPHVPSDAERAQAAVDERLGGQPLASPMEHAVGPQEGVSTRGALGGESLKEPPGFDAASDPAPASDLDDIPF
jgi:hypothetical protein